MLDSWNKTLFSNSKVAKNKQKASFQDQLLGKLAAVEESQTLNFLCSC